MDKPEQRWMVAAMNEAKEYLQSQPGFMEDTDLKALYVVVSTLEAVVMFNEIQPLAQICADFCKDKAAQTAERN